MYKVVINTIFSVLQLIMTLCVIVSCRNRNDRKIAIGLCIYLIAVGVALWI